MKPITYLLLLFVFFSCSNNPSKTGSVFIDVTKDVVIPRNYIVAKTEKPLVIDGLADEAAWDGAEFSQPFIDIEGDKTPKYETRMKMLWDDDFLYVFGKMEEPHVWGNLRQRDTIIFYNNDFEVFIDPSGSTYNYGEIEINALNTVWDLLLDKPYRVGGIPVFHWNLDELKSAIHIDGTLNNPNDIDEGWSIEIAIPMEALVELKGQRSSLPEEGEQWKMGFSRVNWQFDLHDGIYDRKKENGKYLPEYNWVWSPQLVINMHEPEKWGIVQFTTKNSSKGVKLINDDDLLIKQTAYALFRHARFGSLKNLKDNTIGSTQMIEAKYSEDKTPVFANYFKTNFGFEIKLKSPETNVFYTINETGLLKSE